MAVQSRNLHDQIARCAAKQHGAISREQLLSLGATRHQISDRLNNGLLIVEFRGVYRVGHRAPSRLATYMAATLACGEGALLCGRAAAHLFQLIKTPPSSPEVVAPTERRVRGIRTTRWRKGNSPPATCWRGIPVTTVARTLVDLAAVMSPPELARAMHEAQVRYGTTPQQVEAVLPLRAPGRAALRAVVHGDEPVTLSVLEARFLKLLKQHGLPLPVTNRRTDGHYIDCRWPDHAPHRRARQLPLPQHPPRLAAGPPARASSPRAGRRFSPLYARRRGREPARDADRALRAPNIAAMETGTAFTRLTHDADDRFQTLRRELGVSTFGLNLMLLKPGQRGRIHKHKRQEEVYLVLEGTLTLLVENTAHSLEAGAIARVGPEVRRQLVNETGERTAVLAIGGAHEHESRDGVAFASWEEEEGRSPQEVPLPEDVPVDGA